MRFQLKNLALNLLPVSWTRVSSKASIEYNSGILPKILIDVSSLVQFDAGTGIQRVVRNLYRELIAAPPDGFQICPVAATRKQFYRYVSRDFLEKTDPFIAQHEPIQIRPGDLFLGLDLAAHVVPYHIGALHSWKGQGLKMIFFVYDLLPVIEPKWFSPRASYNFIRWLRALAILADSTVAISRCVQKDFHAWMHKKFELSAFDLPSFVIHLGAELDSNLSAGNFKRSPLPANVRNKKFILMVGTIEPRKGHEDILDAFEHLWARGSQTALIIVGKIGWKVQELATRLKSHPENGNRLHWIDNATDELLVSFYEECYGVAVASKGEGFGLPLIEACYFNKPTLARDIPIFREIAAPNTRFFSGSDNLTLVLQDWIVSLEGRSTEISKKKLVTWSDSCAQLVEVLQIYQRKYNTQSYN